MDTAALDDTLAQQRHRSQGTPLGPRQIEILTLLGEGRWSILALLRRMDATTPDERAAVHDSLHRLADRGLVSIAGWHGKSDLTGVVVALTGEAG